MNIVKSFIINSTKQELATVPLGQFDLLRSEISPKSSLECIYNKACVTIMEVGYCTFDLVVVKLEEYPEDGDGTGSDDYTDDAISVLSTQSKKKDEQWMFRISEKLGFHKKWNNQGEVILTWNNTLGDEEDERVQFAVCPDTLLNEIEIFVEVFYKCVYLSRCRKNKASITYENINEMEKISMENYTGKFDDTEYEEFITIEDQSNISELMSNYVDHDIRSENDVYFDANEFPGLNINN